MTVGPFIVKIEPDPDYVCPTHGENCPDKYLVRVRGQIPPLAPIVTLPAGYEPTPEAVQEPASSPSTPQPSPAATTASNPTPHPAQGTPPAPGSGER